MQSRAFPTLNRRHPGLLAAILAALALVPGGRPAVAAQDPQLARLTVRYGDLNLTSASGAHALLRRIEIAAREVCGDDRVAPLQLLNRAQQCYARAVSQAVATVGSRSLTAAFLARYASASLRTAPRG